MTSRTKAAGKEKSSGEIDWQSPSRVGLIDIGSNTVRFVVFDFNGRLPQPIFNERVFCALGAHLVSTGLLSAGARRLALATIQRFTTLAIQMKVDHLDLFATAAIRDARNGPEFSATVFDNTGFEIRVLSGDEEALHSGSGVLSGIPGATGVVGDLGGGSLELVGLTNGKIGPRISLPLGTLRLLDAHPDNGDEARSKIKELLKPVDWLSEYVGQNFYAVGGTWRALARLHMVLNDYPLRILHQYEIERSAAQKFTRDVSDSKLVEAAEQAGISKKRRQAMPVAAMVLNQLFTLVKPASIVISALGLREGILYDRSPSNVRRQDPLIAYCLDMAARRSRFPEHGDDLMRWLAPLYPEDLPAQTRIRRAICLLSDIGWAGHPEYRAELVMDQVLYAQLLGTTHAERAYMALSLFVINGGRIMDETASRARALLGTADIKSAEKLGRALRLGQRVSGGTKKLLGRCALAQEGDKLVLRFKEKNAYLIGAAVLGRLRTLAMVMGLEPVTDAVADAVKD